MPTTTVLGLHVGTSRPLRAGGNVALTIPRVEQEGLSTLTFQDTYNSDAAPAGRGLVSAWFDNDWSTPRYDLDEDALKAEMLAIVNRVLPELAAVTEFTRIDRWRPCTPLNRPGLHTQSAELDRLVPAGDRIQLAGDFFGLATINGAVVAGEVAAERLAV
jgi:oxygen-dependent protoporphyrinogen oxidase